MTEITSAATANAVANPPRSNPLRILYIQINHGARLRSLTSSRSSISGCRLPLT